MKYGVATSSAAEALFSNPLRSLLTMLGIIIGVASVMVMMSIGEGAKAAIEKQISAVGTNVLTLQPGTMNRGGRNQGGGSGRPFNETDVAAVADLPFVESATGILSGQANAVSEEANWVTNIQGGTASFFEVNNWKVDEGRAFSEQEAQGGAAVVVVGKTAAKNLFPGGNIVGQRIRVNSVPVEVIGVLESKGQGGGGGMGPDRDDTLVGPLSMVRNRITGGNRWVSRHVSRIQILVQDGYDVAEAQEEVSTMMRDRRRIEPGQPDNFMVVNFADMIKQRAAVAETMSTLLAFTAAVSLIVGGVGVMNIMLVSVTERTREIGLRMAIGARGGDILLQFLFEAIALCTLGGVIGMAIGWLGVLGYAQLSQAPMVVSPIIVATALGAAASVGLIFGFFPARRAAQLDPIQALRYD
ncbi:MAG: ABC transporter permease [Hyphomonadaceae bacterium]|jgi:putative ABC transport system permease protein|nr:ABC transporter permease [Hyphomonadaceae bacterium]MBP9235552.1 ABC transporter permease [Hyphomonadaceae bacterium]